MGFKRKKVLLRVDFNVPIKDGKITDDTRIVKSLDTIHQLIQSGARIIIMSHLGRPLKELNEDGSINKSKFSLEPIAQRLGEILTAKVSFSTDCGGEDSLQKFKHCKMVIFYLWRILDFTNKKKKEI